MHNNTKIYKTKDFYSACILRASGYTFDHIERGDAKFSIFVFADPKEEAIQAVDRYWKRQFPIEAKDLIDAIHDMKTILYSSN